MKGKLFYLIYFGRRIDGDLEKSLQNLVSLIMETLKEKIRLHPFN